MISSPCNKNCEINELTLLCRDCFRTVDEIANWNEYAEKDKIEIYEQIKSRKISTKKLKD